jgi:hypothetical protein
MQDATRGFAPARTTVGPHFSEAARQMWMVMRREKLTVAGLAKRLARPKSTVWRLLYGERTAGRAFAGEIERALKIPVADWDRPPTRSFTIPVAA